MCMVSHVCCRHIYLGSCRMTESTSRYASSASIYLWMYNVFAGVDNVIDNYAGGDRYKAHMHTYVHTHIHTYIHTYIHYNMFAGHG